MGIHSPIFIGMFPHGLTAEKAPVAIVHNAFQSPYCSPLLGPNTSLQWGLLLVCCGDVFTQMQYFLFNLLQHNKIHYIYCIFY